MRLVTYQAPGGARVAAVRDDGLVDLCEADSRLPSCIKALLAQGPEAIGRAAAAMRSAAAIPRGSVKLLPPVPGPQKVICVGANYADHARESGVRPPDEPILFSKFPTAVRADGDDIVLPAVSSEVDYEAELVVVIGAGGRHIPREKAFEHVAAYACGNDVSARDWQLRKPGNQWLLGKSFDSFAPFGPELVTADEIPDPGNLEIQLRLNGQTMQHSSTKHFIFPIDVLIAYVSQVCTLVPGDLIFTGTPEGVGFARKPPVFLKPGDDVEVEIERIGILRNRVVAES
ncbi:MAG: fumarylacetoacetate hydrolase family protein [Planctomycetia bacterium]|nr:fumarylacetoacetate hydrolase family protein [Planctomycetia bacterium]